MQELDDNALLQEYVKHDSEEAFAMLVTRHVNKVYSVALRHTRNPHQAEEITQAVFVILARKSRKLGRRVVLSGWLYQTARLTASTSIRSDIRRARREQEAYMQSLLDKTESDVSSRRNPMEADWPQIAPLLDAAMAALSETDRHAVVLRFFDGRSTKEVGAALGASEDAAKMRLSRAVEKLRQFFTKRGVVHSAEVLTATITAHSVQTAPVALAKSVTTVALSKGTTASSSTLTLIKGALKIMAWTKAKTAIVVGVGVLIAGAITTVSVKKYEAYKVDRDSWRVADVTWQMVDQALPQLQLLPTKFKGATPAMWSLGDGRWGGVRVYASGVIRAAYHSWQPGRIVFPAGEPKGKWDFMSTLPEGTEEALQQEIKNKLGLVAHPETRDMDVLVLKVRNKNAPGLQPPVSGDKLDFMWFKEGKGHYACRDMPLATARPAPAGGLAKYLEMYLRKPVIDETGLTGNFHIDITWDQPNRQSYDNLKQAMLDQLGLELVPDHLPVEMLIVEKVK